MVSHLILIFIGAEEAAMKLPLLDCDHRFEIQALFSVDQVDAKIVEDLVHLVHDVWVGHHLACVQAHEVVLSHVIRQISEDQSPLLGLIDGGGVNLDVVALPVHVDLLTVVVDDLCGRDDSAITHAEVEECQKVVHILCCQEVWHFQSKVEPPGYTDL